MKEYLGTCGLKWQHFGNEMCNGVTAPRSRKKDWKKMSNKQTIKRTPEPVKPVKKVNEKRRFNFAKRRMDPIHLIPAILFIGIAIWYFISSTQ